MPHLRQVQTALAHDPIRIEDRCPEGAVRAGTQVSVLLRITKEIRASIYGAWLEVYDSSREEALWKRTPLTSCKKGFRGIIDTSGEPRVLFYRFCVRTDVGDVYYASRSDGLATSGNAFIPNVSVPDDQMPKGFQLTVYDADFSVPAWFSGSVMYQIFPDRFARGSAGIRLDGVEGHRAHGWPIELHENWDEPPSWHESYDPIDFFGGTFSGIEEHLDYLSALGVEVLYINPICEARSNHRYDTGN